MDLTNLITTKAGIVEYYQTYLKLEKQIIEVAKYLGIINRCWSLDHFKINENQICITVFDNEDDSYCGPETRSHSFPIECIINRDFLISYKLGKDKAIIEAEMEQKIQQQKALKEKELTELARLKEKYETEEKEMD